MAGTIDQLNFEVILDDKDFNTRVEADIKLAEKLNTQLSKLLQAKVDINKISAQDAANAKRASDIAAKQAIDQERIRKAAELAAAAEEKKRTQAEKTNNEIRKGATESAKAAKEQQRTATEAQRTAAAANQAAVNAQRFRTEQQRTATEAQRTATATQNTARATANAQLAQKRLADYSKQTTRQFQTQSRLLNELKGYALGYLSIHGASQLLSSLVRVTGEFELQKTTLAAMLGDLNAAEGVITRIQGLAVESPFQFKELTSYAKQLSAFSVPAQELYDTTKMLADISAGLGVGMDRIVLAYGQVRSAAFLRGQEVRQFTEAGIPILDELAKQFSELEGRAVSAGEVFDKISARLVPFEMVAKVFKDMTSEGGKFYNMQEVQAETLRGKISNLKDAYEVMLNEIGKGQSENLKGAVDMLRRLMQNYEDVGKAVMQCVVTFGIMKTATEALSASMGKLAVKNIGVIKSLRNVAAFAAKNPYTLIAAGLTAAGVGIYKWATRLEEFEKVQKSVSKTSSEYYKSLAVENSKLDTLYAKLKLAKEGTKEYAEARKQIFTQYAAYISQLRDEGIEVNNLADIYDNLKIKIEESQKAKFRDIASQDINETFNDSTAKLMRKTERKIKALGRDLGLEYNELEKQAIIGYVTSSLSEEEIASNPELRRITDLMSLPVFKSVDKIKKAFSEASRAYVDGLAAIDKLYGKAEDIVSEDNPFVYDVEDEPKGKSPAQKAIEEQIRSVQKLQDAYEKLMPYLNEVQMKSTLKSLFPNISEGVIDSLDFDAELTRLADKLEGFDKEAAQRLRDTISKDIAGGIADTFKAVEQYKKLLDSWLGEDFNLSGEGVSFDLSKIVRDLNNEYSKIDQKRIQALDMLAKAEAGDAEALRLVREKYGEEVWQEYLENGKQTIERLANLERAAAKKNAEERIRDTANKYVREKLQENNIDLTDFGDKNINQVRTILKRLGEMVAETKEEMATLELGGLTEEEQLRMEGLMEVLDILNIKIDDTSEELEKKIDEKVIKMAEDISSAFSTLGKEISSLGQSIDNDLLSQVGMRLSEFGDFAKDLSSGIKDLAEEIKGVDFDTTSWKDLSEGAKGGIVGLIATVAGFAFSKIADIITSGYEAQRRLNEASDEYLGIMLDIRRESYSGLFGTDELGLAAENTKILAEAQERYNDALEELNKKKLQGYRTAGGLGRDGLKKQSVADMLGFLSDSNGWDLYLENGQLNIDALEAYYDTYADRLTKKQRDLVQEIIESGHDVDDATTQQAEYMTSLFSRVADDIATSMVDAFIESGDAAIDMGNIISDVSKQMVADLIKSVYLMPILDSYKAQFDAIDANTALSPTESTEQKLALLDTALQQIAGQSDNINEMLERFSDYLGTGEGTGTSDLGEGIKGITEDQANLLASYLNAIRADVSYSKTLWVKMDANLQRIADMFTSSPTLMEYQAQIAANTYNTAIAAQSILDRLVGVIGVGDNGEAIKVIS